MAAKRAIKKGNYPADIDVLIVTALFDPEYLALENQIATIGAKYKITPIKRSNADKANRLTRWKMTPTVAAYNYTIGTTHLHKMGQADCALETYYLARIYNPRLIILCGIAGTLDPAKVALGDVIIATAVDWRNADKILHTPACATADAYEVEVRQRFRSEFRGDAIDLALKVATEKSAQLPSNLAGTGTNALRTAHFKNAKSNKIVTGPVLTSSFVLNHKGKRDAFAKDKVLAIEMEAAGAELARQMINKGVEDDSAVDLIVVRGICDECHKKKDTAWRTIASENAMWTTLEYLAAYLA